MRVTRPLGSTWAVAAVAVAGSAVAQLVVAQRLPSGTGGTRAADVVAANAYGMVSTGRILMPSSLSATAVSRQLWAYDALTGSSSRHSSLVGNLREFTAVLAVLGALAMVGLARSVGLRPLPALGAVILGYLTPTLVAAGATAFDGVVAGAWLTLSLLLIVRAARGGVIVRAARSGGIVTIAAGTAGALALGMAAVVAPWCLAVAPAYVAGHLLTVRARSGAGRRGRRVAVAGLAAATAAILGWATTLGPLASGGRPDPVATGAGSGTMTAAVIVGALGVFLVAVVAVTVPGLRVLAVALTPLPVAAVLGHAGDPAVVLAAPLLGLLLVGAVDDLWSDGFAARPRKRWGLAAVLAVGAAAVVAVGFVVVPAAAPVAVRAPDAARIAAWLAENLRAGTVVVAEPVLWAELSHAGVPTSRLQLAEDAAVSARASTEGAVRLQSTCPAPLAAFGSMPQRVFVCVIPDDATPGVDPATDLRQRQLLGQALAGNPRITASEGDRALLAAGAVDPRIVAVLAAAAATFRFTIAGLPDDAGDLRSGADPTSGPVRRHARLTDIVTADPAAAGRPGDAAARLRKTFRRQLPTYQPRSAVLTGDVLTVTYAAPAPTGPLS